MDQSGTTEEPNMRLNIKQTAKGSFYAEWTVRGNVIQEIKARNEEMQTYATDQVKKLNGS